MIRRVRKVVPRGTPLHNLPTSPTEHHVRYFVKLQITMRPIKGHSPRMMQNLQHPFIMRLIIACTVTMSALMFWYRAVFSEPSPMHSNWAVDLEAERRKR